MNFLATGTSQKQSCPNSSSEIKWIELTNVDYWTCIKRHNCVPLYALNLKSSILMTNLQEKDMNIYWEAKLESEQF